MRVDKFLWCTRIYKSRSIAAEQCRREKIRVNNEVVKASREIRIGDVIIARKGAVHFSFEVRDFPSNRVGAKLITNFITDVTTAEEKRKLEMILEQHRADRPRGLGRPTKRDRREIDMFFEYEEPEEES